MGEDFIFVPCDGTEPTAEMVKKLYLEEVQKYGLEQVQILTSYRVKTAAGVVELNRTLEDLINPPAIGKSEITIGKDVFRVGDKILQNKNTDLVSNGDMGIIQDIYEDSDESQKVQILFSKTGWSGTNGNRWRWWSMPMQLLSINLRVPNIQS